MSKLLIVGAGGLASCALDIATAMNTFSTIAFLDDHKLEVCGCRVLGKIQDLQNYYPKFDCVCVAIGDNTVRKQLLEKAKEIGYRIVNLKHPSAVVSNFAKVGEGNILFPNVVIEANAKVGNGNVICANTVIQHDAQLDDYCLVYSNTTLRAYSHVQDEVRIGSNCCVTFQTVIEKNASYDDGVVIGKEVKSCM